MFKVLKKVLLHSLPALMLLVVTACGATGVQPSESSGQAGQSAQKAAVPITLVTSDNNQTVPSVSQQSSLDEFVYLKEALGIDLSIVFLAHSQYAELLNMKIASSDMGDAFMVWTLRGNEFIDGGNNADLTEYVSRLAPDVTKIIQDRGLSWDSYTSMRGDVCGLPFFPSANINNKSMFIRQDWLEYLGLEIPKTSDELLEVLRAFRDNDPNRNGQKDEQAFICRADGAWTGNIFSMWGPALDYVVDESGNITGNIFMDPVKKCGIEYLRQMYSEKLMAQDYVTLQRPDQEARILADLVGVWCHDAALAADWQKRFNEALPNKSPKVLLIDNPVGTGYIGATPPATGLYNPLVVSSWVIPNKTDKEKIESIVTFYNWLNTQEGMEFAALGAPNKNFTKAADGTITYDSDADLQAGWRNQILGIHYIPYELNVLLKGKEAADLVLNAASENQAPVNTVVPYLPVNMVNSDPYSTLNSEYTQLFNKIVMGEEKIEAYDAWVIEKQKQFKPYWDEMTEFKNNLK